MDMDMRKGRFGILF